RMREKRLPDGPPPIHEGLRSRALRVAAIDMGTNSTRLLVADVGDGRVEVIRRESRVTGLGRGVEISDQLSTEAIERVFGAISDYLAIASELGAVETLAFATSAARDGAHSAAFIAELRERFDLSASVLSGEEEAELTYLGARGSCADCETVVVDIGGGSSQLVVGSGGDAAHNTALTHRGDHAN